MRLFAFDPADSLFFRSGIPFNQDDPGQARAESVFPPSPMTVVGALRAAFARKQGWSGIGRWEKNIVSILGDRDELEGIRFHGPYLIRDRVRLFPAPRFLVGRKRAGDNGKTAWTDIERISPDAESLLDTDIGAAIALPTGPSHNRKLIPLDGAWLTPDGMIRVLSGDVPGDSDVVDRSSLWSMEPRVGIGRDNAKRTAKAGQLYAATHVRLHEREYPEGRIRIAAGVEGLPADWQPANPIPLGGEHRMAWVEEVDEISGSPLRIEKATIPGSRIGVAILATPAYAQSEWMQPGGRLGPEISGTIVSACIGKADPVGGWDSLSGPKPLSPTLAPGSAWFLKRDDAWSASDATPSIGIRTNWGFGEVLLGTCKSEV